MNRAADQKKDTLCFPQVGRSSKEVTSSSRRATAAAASSIEDKLNRFPSTTKKPGCCYCSLCCYKNNPTSINLLASLFFVHQLLGKQQQQRQLLLHPRISSRFTTQLLQTASCQLQSMKQTSTSQQRECWTVIFVASSQGQGKVSYFPNSRKEARYQYYGSNVPSHT